jgi:pheromone shutdown protein TraB
MSSMLLKSAREYSSVVAVVGKGHVSGIKKNWQQPIQVSFFFSNKKNPNLHVIYITSFRNRKWITGFIAVLQVNV